MSSNSKKSAQGVSPCKSLPAPEARPHWDGYQENASLALCMVVASGFAGRNHIVLRGVCRRLRKALPASRELLNHDDRFSLLFEACLASNVDMLRWITAEDPNRMIRREVRGVALNLLVMKGCRPALEWLLLGPPGWLEEHGCTALEEAAMCGNMGLLEWLSNHATPKTCRGCWWACHEGNLEILRWWRRKGYPWYAYACQFARSSGHEPLVKWFHESGCPCSCKAPATASFYYWKDFVYG